MNQKSKPFLRTLENIDFILIVFTKHEIKLYNKSLDIKKEKLKYLPYSDWVSNSLETNNEIGDYYFTGGYSNRDYKTIIDVFNKNRKKLILVCSKLNKEVFKIKVCDNIKILTDFSSYEFDDLVRGARACILFLKYEKGASGQSVILRYIRNAKAIIINKSKLILEFVNKESAFILPNPLYQLESFINKIDDDIELIKSKGMKAYRNYKNKFSIEAGMSNLQKILSDND